MINHQCKAKCENKKASLAAFKDIYFFWPEDIKSPGFDLGLNIRVEESSGR